MNVTDDPLKLLAANASAQVLAASLLGVAMLIPMQPWAKKLRPGLNAKALLSAHLDWLMLAFMQWGAAFTMLQWPQTRSLWVAWLLMFGGWVNALPYLFRGAGIDAFVFGGRWPQRVAASLSGVSSLAIIVAWSMVGLSWVNS
jgi:hypothetical protein